MKGATKLWMSGSDVEGGDCAMGSIVRLDRWLLALRQPFKLHTGQHGKKDVAVGTCLGRLLIG